MTKAANKSLVDKMDELAGQLIATLADGTQETIEDRLAVFERVAKWVAIRNKISELDEGTGLNDYRSKLKSSLGQPSGNSAAKSGARKLKPSGFTASAADVDTTDAGADFQPISTVPGTTSLASLRARIPAADNRGDVSNSNAGGSTGDTVRISVGSPSIGWASDAKPGSDQGNGSGGV